MGKKKKNLPALQQEGAFAVLDQNPEEIAEMIETNLGAFEPTPFDLTNIKWPTGGGIMFVVPGPKGERSEPEIQGVVIHTQSVRAYWSSPDPTAEPPQCSSVDCKVGIGDPGGLCKLCPWSQFGSGKDNSQACNHKLRMFMIQPAGILPIVISIPPSSIKVARKFFLSLVSAQMPLFSVVIGLSLVKVKSNKGIDYALAEFKVISDLTPEQAEKMKRVADSIRPMLTDVGHNVESAVDLD